MSYFLLLLGSSVITGGSRVISGSGVTFGSAWETRCGTGIKTMGTTACKEIILISTIFEGVHIWQCMEVTPCTVLAGSSLVLLRGP